MSYVLVDTHGSSIASYEEREPAVAAYEAMLADDPAARGEVAILVTDPSGRTIDRLHPASATA